jgi:hypothetical protein
MRNLVHDLRYALRQLRNSPGFSLIVVLMLALGIGANTAVFSVMNAVLMQLLPVNQPEGLSYVHIGGGENQAPGGWNTGDGDTSFSEATFEAFRQRSDVFEELIGYVPSSFTGNVPVRYGELPEDAEGEEVSGNFFSGLGARIERGRGFSLDDEKNHAPIAVISYDYWTRRFARDPGVLGHTLYVRGVPLTIVGIAAHGFQSIEPATSTDFWIPLQNRPELNAWGTVGTKRFLTRRDVVTAEDGATQKRRDAATGWAGAVRHFRRCRHAVVGQDRSQGVEAAARFRAGAGHRRLQRFLSRAGAHPHGARGDGAADRVHQRCDDGAGAECGAPAPVQLENGPRRDKATILRQLLPSLLLVTAGHCLGGCLRWWPGALALDGVEAGLSPDRTYSCSRWPSPARLHWRSGLRLCGAR